MRSAGRFLLSDTPGFARARRARASVMPFLIALWALAHAACDKNGSPERPPATPGWQALGPPGMDGPVMALTLYRERLIAAGEFSYAGGTPAAGIAEWDGERWRALGEGLSWGSGIPRVYGMAVYEDALIVCGTFDAAGGEAIEDLARWDGTDWTALGSGTDGWISASCFDVCSSRSSAS